MRRRDVALVLVLAAVGAGLGLWWRLDDGSRADFVPSRGAGTTSTVQVDAGVDGLGRRVAAARPFVDSLRERIARGEEPPLEPGADVPEDVRQVVALERVAWEMASAGVELDGALLLRAWPDNGAEGALLAAHPPGLGVPGHPLRDHARAYVRLILALTDGGLHDGVIDVLGDILSERPAAFLDVFLESSLLARAKGVPGPLTPSAMFGRTCRVCRVLGDERATRHATDELARAARDAQRPDEERDAAAYLVAELGDLPLCFELPRTTDTVEERSMRRGEVLALWDEIRTLGAAESLRRRCEAAMRARMRGAIASTNATLWLARHLGDADAVHAIVLGESDAVDVLRAAVAPSLDADATAADVLALGPLLDECQREADQLMRLLADEHVVPPARPRSLHPTYVFRRWPAALGLDREPLRVHAARIVSTEPLVSTDALVSTEEGPRIDATYTGTVVSGERLEFEHEAPLECLHDPELAWRPPGLPRSAVPLPRVVERLSLGVSWGTAAYFEDLELEVREVHRGGVAHESVGVFGPAFAPAGLVAKGSRYADGPEPARWLVRTSLPGRVDAPASIEAWEALTRSWIARYREARARSRRGDILGGPVLESGLAGAMDALGHDVPEGFSYHPARSAGGGPRSSVAPARELPVVTIGIVAALWGLVLVVATAAVRRGFAHGRMMLPAALLLATCLVLGPLRAVFGGFDLAPAWLAWGGAAGAAFLLARGSGSSRLAMWLFAAAALSAAVADLAESPAARRLEAACVAVAVVALAPLSHGVLTGLRNLDERHAPPRIPAGVDWRRAVATALLLALIATPVVFSLTKEQTLDHAIESAGVYASICLAIVGLVAWRVGLRSRAAEPADRVTPLPGLFVIGTVLPASFLIALDGGPWLPWRAARDVPPVMLGCAVAYVVLRLIDAARIRDRSIAIPVARGKGGA